MQIIPFVFFNCFSPEVLFWHLNHLLDLAALQQAGELRQTTSMSAFFGDRDDFHHGPIWSVPSTKDLNLDSGSQWLLLVASHYYFQLAFGVLSKKINKNKQNSKTYQFWSPADAGFIHSRTACSGRLSVHPKCISQWQLLRGNGCVLSCTGIIFFCVKTTGSNGSANTKSFLCTPLNEHVH